MSTFINRCLRITEHHQPKPEVKPDMFQAFMFAASVLVESQFEPIGIDEPLYLCTRCGEVGTDQNTMHHRKACIVETVKTYAAKVIAERQAGK